MLHEDYIKAVVDLASARLCDKDRAALHGVKVAYGAGAPGRRGVTFYDKWSNGDDTPVPFVEVCAFGEESTVQLVGTTLHELGHVLAGHGAGHGAGWKAACERLGIKGVKAAGTVYSWDMLETALCARIRALPVPDDGAPVEPMVTRLGRTVTVRPCGAGFGVRGGTSRGTGSGSRLVKVECASCGYVARISQKWIDSPGPAHCPDHGAMNVV